VWPCSKGLLALGLFQKLAIGYQESILNYWFEPMHNITRFESNFYSHTTEVVADDS
jgi:hypothetical protein